MTPIKPLLPIHVPHWVKTTVRVVARNVGTLQTVAVWDFYPKVGRK